VRLVTFIAPGALDERTGVVEADSVVDLTDETVGLPASMPELLGLGDSALQQAARAASGAARRFEMSEVHLLAPVPRPPKVLAIGMNYRGHVAELGREAPDFQYWFNKQRTCVVGPGEPIVIPAVSEMVDYEGELAVIIGRRCEHVPAQRWLDVVAGFSVMNDVSVRDWQWRTPTFTMGKSFPTHGPLGPFLVTPDEVGPTEDLGLRTWVNDELRQDSSTADLIFSCAEMIEYLTSAFALEPGDVISTGTPAGVAAGMDSPKWLRPGDVVRIEVESVGSLENPVDAAPPPTPLGLD